MCGFGHGEGCYKPGWDALRTNTSIRDFQVTIIQTCPVLCGTKLWEGEHRGRSDAAAVKKRKVSKLLPAFHFTSLTVAVKSKEQ